MVTVKSLEDLRRIRDEALAKRRMKTTEGETQIVVAMGTCGIAAGARDTMKAILGAIEEDNLQGITVTQTGCMGLCEWEPIVEVTAGEGPKVRYGRVTPQKARQILREHVAGGQVVSAFVIEPN